MRQRKRGERNGRQKEKEEEEEEEVATGLGERVGAHEQQRVTE